MILKNRIPEEILKRFSAKAHLKIQFESFVYYLFIQGHVGLKGSQLSVLVCM